MTDYVVLLGTKGGPAIRPGSNMPTSHLLCLNDRQIVVDCGLGVSRGLTDHGMQLKDLGLIFITHMHSDHYLELGPLIHTAWTAGLNSKVTVYGPKGLNLYWNGFLQSMKADIDLRIEDEGRPDLKKLLEIRVIDGEEVLNEGGLSVSAMRNVHPPLIDTFALSFQTERSHVVFSGDTAFLPELSDFAKGADLLVHEAMLGEALGPLMERIGNVDDRLMTHWLRSHTFAADAGKIATEAGVKALALSHMIPSGDPEFTEKDWQDAIGATWSGPFYFGSDGLRIDLN